MTFLRRHRYRRDLQSALRIANYSAGLVVWGRLLMRSAGYGMRSVTHLDQGWRANLGQPIVLGRSLGVGPGAQELIK